MLLLLFREIIEPSAQHGDGRDFGRPGIRGERHGLGMRIRQAADGRVIRVGRRHLQQRGVHVDDMNASWLLRVGRGHDDEGTVRSRETAVRRDVRVKRLNRLLLLVRLLLRLVQQY